MNPSRLFRVALPLSLCSAFCITTFPSVTLGATFTNSYLDGGTWNTILAQGFSPEVAPSPNPGLAPGAVVNLQEFRFFKSGFSDSASDIRLAIIEGFFSDLSGGLSIGSSPVVGISDNTIASTASLNLSDPIAFGFSDLPLTYDGDYGAVLVNVGGGGELTPVLVSALTANYVDDGSGTFVPESNYGTDMQFEYAVSSNINGGFFETFSFAADANFEASFSFVPEPATGVLLALFLPLLHGNHRRP